MSNDPVAEAAHVLFAQTKHRKDTARQLRSNINSLKKEIKPGEQIISNHLLIIKTLDNKYEVFGFLGEE